MLNHSGIEGTCTMTSLYIQYMSQCLPYICAVYCSVQGGRRGLRGIETNIEFLELAVFAQTVNIN